MRITLLRAYAVNTNHELEIYSDDKNRLYLSILGVDDSSPILLENTKDNDGFIAGIKYALSNFSKYTVC